ncbi:exosome complex component RRP42-like protein [Leptotrombidium deliense]|uniref:Ribosomal RNA-processing protein 42 n=1 Tax=Leptotrombidium deliense TaxID=299467 RepID=A0A443SMC2_9ACAR|nr:exosome complex component RRP42-like protein [Leptotrombidium deliense]
MDLILSDYEKVFVCEGVKQNCRVDGRECFDYRCVHVETDVISSCSGSGHVRLGNCEIMVGVKCELSDADIDNPSVGKVEFSVDVSPNASPLFDRKNDSLCNLVVSALSQAIPRSLDLRKLCIVEGKHVWTLFIDILVLELGSKSNMFDACSIAVKAALFNTKIPRVNVDMESNDVCVSEGYDKIDVSDVPILLTITRVSNQYIVDATQEEEASCISSVVLAIVPDGEIVYTKKVKYGSLCPEPFKETLQRAKDLAITMHQNLMIALTEESGVKKPTNKISFLF